MITLTQAVIADLESHFSENEKQDIRIYLAPEHLPHNALSFRLALVLDHAQEDDGVYEVSGYRFCFQKDLLTKCGGIDIDLSDTGFIIEPRIPFEKKSKKASCASNCGSCASKCSL